MGHKELGNTGIEIPDIGLGTWAYKGGPPLEECDERRGATLSAPPRCSK